VILIPAIDLMDGQVVRLRKGEAGDMTRYGVDAATTAAEFHAAGASRLHVVDLDGAFGGVPKNLEVIRAVRAAVPGMEMEVGGGLRTRDSVVALFDAGVDYAVIGTKALEDEDFLLGLLDEFGHRIIVGADAREGRLATRGWTSQTEVEAVPFLRRLNEEAGLATVIFTDIARDGMLNGPNLDALTEVLKGAPGLQVIASGGVGEARHVRELAQLPHTNLLGVITGKALYDGRMTVAEGLMAAGHIPGE
jgi:phosphoribosylformimino-5-aminoimidazole carboxamide ribotide isomerase